MLDHIGARDGRGVTPVIGAVLLISITVLLAAMVATTSLGHEAMRDPPQASLSVDATPSADEITVDHAGGDTLHASQTRLVVTVDGTRATFDAIPSSAVLSVGSSAVIDIAGDDEVDWDGDGTYDAYAPTEDADVLPALTDGDEVTVRLVDVDNEVVFFETTVIA